MKRLTMKDWQAKTQKLNSNRDLVRGCRVVDYWGATGIVVRILSGSTNEQHGTIYVWQDTRMSHGADNCEHYAHVNWRENLRMLEDPNGAE